MRVKQYLSPCYQPGRWCVYWDNLGNARATKRWFPDLRTMRRHRQRRFKNAYKIMERIG